MTALAVVGVIFLGVTAVGAVSVYTAVSMVQAADRVNPYRSHNPDAEECQCPWCYGKRRDRRL